MSPRWIDPLLAGVVLLTVLLQAVSWWILDGYQLADSVEYLEHAQAFSRGQEVVDSHVIRSYGFITLLTPLFLVSDWLGLEDLKPLVWLARGMQMLFGVLLVLVCARIATRLAGRRAGRLAAFLVAANPVFLQYSVSPIADVAAALCVGLGTDGALRRGGARRGLFTGLWFGAALMIAYKTLLVTVPLLGFLLLRDLRRLAYVGGVLAGLVAGVVAQVGLDKAVYGKWGISLANYVIVNTSPIVPFALHRIGQDDLAKRAYDMAEAAARQEGDLNADPGDLSATPRRLKGVHWYLQELPSMLVWPVIAAGLVGLVACLVRASWTSSLLLFVLLVNYAIMSQKGSKDFRLWLPLLPALAPLCAWGLDLAWRGLRGPRVLRALAAVLVLASTLTMGMHTLLDRNTRKFSGYWDAMRIVDGEAARERGPGEAKVRVASAYHWAVYLRESADVELVKLPHHLSRWNAYTDEQRGASVAAILQQDWFITHLAVLSNHIDLMQAINDGFEVHSLLWDHEDYEDIGPVFVLRRRRPDDPREPLGRRFFQVLDVEDPDAYRRSNLLPPPTRFVRDFPGLQRREEVWLLGWEYEQLPGDGHGWITYHWYCVEQPIADYTVVDRLTTFDELHSWQNNHAPLYGARPTPTWEPGKVYRESWPVVAASDPYDWRKPFRPMGGPYRRGDLMPATLWVDLATFGEGGAITGRMEAARFGQQQPVRSGAQADVETTPDGFAFNKDGMVRVGRLFVPVHERARVPDDGRAIRE